MIHGVLNICKRGSKCVLRPIKKERKLSKRLHSLTQSGFQLAVVKPNLANQVTS